MSDSQETIDSRVARLEIGFANLTAQISQLVSAVGSHNDKLSSLGRPNWSLLIASFGILVPVLGFGFWVNQQTMTNMILPLQTRADRSEIDRSHLNNSVEKMDDAMDMLREEMRSNSATFRASLTEIETQFAAQSQLGNMRAAARQQTSALLWRKVYGEDLPNGEYFYNMSQNRSQTQ